MKLILLSGIILLHTLSLKAQAKLIQENHYEWDLLTLEEKNDKIIPYEYDEQGRVILRAEKHWVEDIGWEIFTEDEYTFNANGDPTLVSHWVASDKAALFFTSSYRYVTEYDNRNRKTRSRYLLFHPGIKDWSDIRINTWHYDDDECLIREERIHFDQLSGTHVVTSEDYYNSNTCQADSSIAKTISSGNTEWRLNAKKYYDFNEEQNTLYTQIYSWNSEIQNWIPKQTKHQKFDAQGRLIENEILSLTSGNSDRFIRSFNDQGLEDYYAHWSRLDNEIEFHQASETIRVYDDLGNLLFLQKKINEELVEQIIYDYQYDDNAYLIQLNYNSTEFNGENIQVEEYSQSFENYCDGLARESTINQPSTDFKNPSTTLIEYIYDEGINCESPQKQFPASIYPNPSLDGLLKIKSDLLLFTPIQFEVFNNLGRQVSVGELYGRNKEHTLNLSHLKNGIYYLKLIHKKLNIN